MYNKGYVRTLEAVIAIILILIVIYTIIPKHVEPQPDIPLVVHDAQQFIISDITNNESLRTLIVISEGVGASDNLRMEIENVIKSHIPPNYDFVCAICPQTNPCIQTTPLEKAVYMSDVFIASSLGRELREQNPKIVRFWIWLKPTQDISVYNTCQDLSTHVK